MISIIIPVYNGEEHIHQCVKSLLEQKNGCFEVVFVNDGSSDGSEQIIQKYCDANPFFYLVNQSNRGVSIARENGVNYSRGDYIMFMDIDDTIKPNTISYLEEQIIINPTIDIFVSGYDIIYSNRIQVISFTHSVVNNFQYLKFFLTQGRWALWGKLFKKKLFNDIITPSDFKMGEDAIVLVQLAMRANQVFITNLCLYNYIQYETSVSYRKSQEIAYQGIYAASFIQKLLEDSNYRDILKNEIDIMYLLFFSNSLRRGYIDKKDLSQDIKQHISIESLRRIGFLKSFYILFNLYGGEKVYRLFQKMFSYFYKS